MTGISDGTDSTSYSYDTQDRIAVRDGVGFTYAGGELDPTSDGNDLFHRSPDGGLLAYETGAGSTSHPYSVGHRDLNGLFGSDGVLSDSQTFDPYGDPVDETGSTDPVLGYQSDYTDPDTEHVWMGARWYQPSSGTFLSRDTVYGELRTPFSLNRYTYAVNNPVRYWDPDGRWPGEVEYNAYLDAKEKEEEQRQRKAKASSSSRVTSRVTRPANQPGQVPSATTASTETIKAAGSNPGVVDPMDTNWGRFATKHGLPVYAGMYPVAATPSPRSADDCIRDTSCAGEELTRALGSVGLGEAVFGAIDVANEGNVGKLDGNWSSDDVAAAASGRNLAAISEQMGFTGRDVADFSDVVQSVAGRLEGHESLYEAIDDDNSWYQKGIVGWGFENRSMVAGAFAMGMCAISLGWGCLAASTFAWAVRSQQRDGWAISGADVADGVFTFGTLGLVKIPASLAVPAAGMANTTSLSLTQGLALKGIGAAPSVITPVVCKFHTGAYCGNS